MDQPKEYPMTELELRLKACLNEREDIRSHILSAEELEQYTSWMANSYGRGMSAQAQERLIRGVHTEQGGAMMALGRSILSDPSDSSLLRQLSSHWGNQHERSYIQAEQDISAWQMLRYMPAHWHQNDFFELYYSLSGECPVHFTNEIVVVKPGTVLIVAPGILHANPCYGDDKMLVTFNIRTSTFEQVFWKQIPPDNLMAVFFRQALSGKQPNSYIQFETDGDAEIRSLLQKVFEEYQTGKAYSAKLMNAYMSACFILLIRSYEGTVRLPRTESFYWKHEYSAILSHIQTHFDEVRLSDLADRFHYSEKQIRRIVQTYTGMSFSDLITRLRMERAALLLRRENIRMEDIAAAVGYTTVSSFYRAFMSYYGCTPGSFASTREPDEYR